jgi:hypothetical protein
MATPLAERAEGRGRRRRRRRRRRRWWWRAVICACTLCVL